MVAVSPDSEQRTAEHCEAFQLTQTVLLDPERAIAAAYGVTRVGGWLPNRRVTYLIGEDGEVQAAHHGELSLAGHLDLLEKIVQK